MKKIVIYSTTGQTGTDSWDFYEFSDNVTDDTLNKMAQEVALENAETYGLYPPCASYDEYDDGESVEEDWDSVDENIEGSWSNYDPNLHDDYTLNGVPDWIKV